MASQDFTYSQQQTQQQQHQQQAFQHAQQQQQQQQRQPSPSKSSVQRSKTVRNLGSAGSKMRGLFKKQKDRDDKGDDQQTQGNHPMHYSDRPMSYPDAQMMEHALSSGNHRYSSLVAQPEVNMTNSTTSNTLSSSTTTGSSVEEVPPEAEELRQQLEQLHMQMVQVRKEVQGELERREQLQTELDETRRLYQDKEQEYSQIEHRFFQLTRAVRATDDDLSTIRDSLKLLKYNISRIILSLNKKADKERAKAKYVAKWPHLQLLDSNGDLAEPSFVNLLAEKLIHTVLVENVFQSPLYPGLDINDAYATLSQWFDQHDSTFAVRLRQQLAATIAKHNDPNLQATIANEKARLVTLIYDELADIYHPFLRENDAQVPQDKSYHTKIADIVDKTFKLVVAIRGQEVVIHALAIDEGKQALDEETMTDARGKTEGTVRFCVCPTFVGGDGDHGFLEKGKVVIF